MTILRVSRVGRRPCGESPAAARDTRFAIVVNGLEVSVDDVLLQQAQEARASVFTLTKVRLHTLATIYRDDVAVSDDAPLRSCPVETRTRRPDRPLEPQAPCPEGAPSRRHAGNC